MIQAMSKGNVHLTWIWLNLHVDHLGIELGSEVFSSYRGL